MTHSSAGYKTYATKFEWISYAKRVLESLDADKYRKSKIKKP